MRKLFYISLFILMGIAPSQAQDIHYSMFDLMPIQLSPVGAGNFNGDYRFSGIYRNQWATIAVPYNSTSLAFDLKAYETKKFNSFLGSGLMLMFDQAGDSKFQSMYAQIPVSYLLNFDVNGAFISVGAGLGVGWMRKSINTSALSFDNQFTGEVYDPTIPNNESFGNLNFSNVDLSAGYYLGLKSRRDFEFAVNVGLHHLNKIQESFLNDGLRIQLEKRIGLQALMRFPIKKKWAMQFDYLWQEQGPKSEFVLGAKAIYYLKKDLPAQKAISFGAGTRFNDAFIARVGYIVNNFKVELAYDVNYSSLTIASNTYGGVEIGAVYIIQKVKEPEIKNKRQCFVF